MPGKIENPYRLTTWGALGKPSKPGKYPAADVGLVSVSQEDIDQMKGLGSDARVKVKRVGMEGKVRLYEVVELTPLSAPRIA